MKPEISFEFFPPQTAEGAEKLRATRRQLAQLKPAFFSVHLRRRRLDARPHAGDGAGNPGRGPAGRAAPVLHRLDAQDNVRAVLDRYQAAGIRRIVALRGDLPSGMADPGEFRYANELVEFIRVETGDWFHIEVAAYPEYHPQAKSPRDDLPTSSARSTPAPTRPSRSTSTTPTPTPISSTRRRRSASRADRAGHHADRQLQQDRPLLGRLRRGDPALDAPEVRELGDDSASVRAFGLDVVTELCERCSTWRRARPALLHRLNQAGTDQSTIWQRLCRARAAYGDQ
jgi:methylenetetrahydrofolate reductase (NADPH)